MSCLCAHYKSIGWRVNAAHFSSTHELLLRMCRRLLSTDPEAAKEVVLAEKPVIADTSSNLEPALLNVLLANLSTLSSVYHKPPEVHLRSKRTISVLLRCTLSGIPCSRHA